MLRSCSEIDDSQATAICEKEGALALATVLFATFGKSISATLTTGAWRADAAFVLI